MLTFDSYRGLRNDLEVCTILANDNMIIFIITNEKDLLTLLFTKNLEIVTFLSFCGFAKDGATDTKACWGNFGSRNFLIEKSFKVISRIKPMPQILHPEKRFSVNRPVG